MIGSTAYEYVARRFVAAGQNCQFSQVTDCGAEGFISLAICAQEKNDADQARQ